MEGRYVELLFDSYFEDYGIFRVWARIVYCIFVLCPWKSRAVSHGINFWKQGHQCAIANVSLNGLSVKYYFVPNFMVECARSLLTFTVTLTM